MDRREIVVIGAGPAGLEAARTLAFNKRDVLVLERKGIIGDKVCAGGLTNNAMKFKIPGSILQRKFSKMLVSYKNNKSYIKTDSTFIATVDRKDLGKWMASEAEKQGAEIKTGVNVISIGSDFIVTNKGKIGFEYLIGADGSNSVVRKSLGLKTT